MRKEKKFPNKQRYIEDNEEFDRGNYLPNKLRLPRYNWIRFLYGWVSWKNLWYVELFPGRKDEENSFQ